MYILHPWARAGPNPVIAVRGRTVFSRVVAAAGTRAAPQVATTQLQRPSVLAPGHGVAAGTNHGTRRRR